MHMYPEWPELLTLKTPSKLCSRDILIFYALHPSSTIQRMVERAYSATPVHQSLSTSEMALAKFLRH